MSDYPTINGHRYSWASMQVMFNGVPIKDITSVHYEPFPPIGEVAVAFSRYLPRYSVRVFGGKVFAGSREALDLALFRENKSWRPRLRGLRNPSRSSRRTDFGRRIDTGEGAR